MNIRYLTLLIVLLAQTAVCAAQNKVYDGGSLFVNGFARIQKDHGYFYIDSLGNYAFDQILNNGTLLPASDEDGSLGGPDSTNNQLPSYFILVAKKGKLGILSLDNKWVLQPLYDSIDTRYKPEWVVTKDGKKSLFTSKGFKVPFKYEDIYDMDGVHFNVKQNGKWGVYSRQEDKMIIPFVYEDLDYCYGCEAKGNYVFAQKNGKWGVVDFNNKVLVPFAYEHMHMNMRSDEWVESLYKDGHQMTINLNTGKVDTCGRDDAVDSGNDQEEMADGFIRQRKNDKWGMLDAKGKLILDYKYDFIRYDHDLSGYYLPAPFVALNYKDKHGVADTTGKIIIDPLYDDWFSCLDNTYFVSGMNGQESIFDLKGNRVLQGTYDHIEDWMIKTGKDSIKLLKLTKGKQYGFYNTKTKQLIQPQYSYLYTYNETDGKDWIEVEKDNKRGYIDANGHTVVPPVYDYIRMPKNAGSKFLIVTGNNQSGIFDVQRQKLVVPLKYESVSSMTGTDAWQVLKNGKSGLLDSSGQILCETNYDLINPLNSKLYLLIKVDSSTDKYTYNLLNSQTRKIEVLPFDSLSYIAKGTVLVVADSGKTKLFDASTGKFIQGDYSFGGYPDVIGPFEEDRAAFRKNNKTGYIDPAGHILIAPDHALLTERFFDGVALVADPVDSSMQAFHYGYMDSTGKIIVPIVYDLTGRYATNFDINDFFADGYLLLLKRDPKDDYHYWQGYATQKGQIFILPNYDKITPVNDHAFYLVQKDKKKGILDSAGHEVLPVDFDDFQLSSDYSFSIVQKLSFPLAGYKEKTWQYYTKDGQKLPLQLKNMVDFAPPYNDQSTVYYDYNGNYGIPNQQGQTSDKTKDAVLDGHTDASGPARIEVPSVTGSKASKTKDASNESLDSSTIVAADEVHQEAVKEPSDSENAGIRSPFVSPPAEVSSATAGVFVPPNAGENPADASLEDDDTSIIFTTVEKAPSFPGGQKSMELYIKKHTKIPQEAKEAGVSGKVFVRIEVTKDGKIKNVASTYDNVGHNCAEEAVRVIKAMPDWKPGLQNGTAVNVWVTVPVIFETK